MMTGYFGIPGGIGGKVHFIRDDGRPVCGTKMSSLAEFQFCASEIAQDLVECQRCRVWNKKRLTPKDSQC